MQIFQLLRKKLLGGMTYLYLRLRVELNIMQFRMPFSKNRALFVYAFSQTSFIFIQEILFCITNRKQYVIGENWFSLDKV